MCIRDSGSAAADDAAETARKTFEEGASAEGLPTVTIDLSAGVGILAASVAAGLAASNGEARRAIQGGGIRVNDEIVKDDKLVLTTVMAKAGAIKLSHGKKKHVLLKQG